MRNKLFGGLIALMFIISSIASALTASSSFTAVGNGNSIFVKNLDSLTYSVSGTFVGTVVLERTRDNGLSWDYVLSAAAAASGTIKVETPAMESAVYRFRCSAFTSGTIVTSIADASAEVPPAQEFKNVLGKVVGGIGETGLYSQDFSVTGTMSAATGEVIDSTFSIKDNSDPTKIAQFQLSGISTATTRTYTLPDANATLVPAASPSISDPTITGTTTAAIVNTSGKVTHAAQLVTTPAAVASAASITNLASSTSAIRLGGSTATTIHGITAGTNGQLLWIINTTNANLTIKHLSGSATGAQIYVPTGADSVSTSDSAALLMYSTGDSAWILMNHSL